MVPNVASGVNLQCGSQKVCSEAEIGNQMEPAKSKKFHPKNGREITNSINENIVLEATSDQCIPWDLTINERVIKNH